MDGSQEYFPFVRWHRIEFAVKKLIAIWISDATKITSILLGFDAFSIIHNIFIFTVAHGGFLFFFGRPNLLYLGYHRFECRYIYQHDLTIVRFYHMIVRKQVHVTSHSLHSLPLHMLSYLLQTGCPYQDRENPRNSGPIRIRTEKIF